MHNFSGIYAHDNHVFSAIVLSVLQKDKGHINHVDVELADRGVKPPMPLKDMK